MLIEFKKKTEEVHDEKNVGMERRKTMILSGQAR